MWRVPDQIPYYQDDTIYYLLAATCQLLLLGVPGRVIQSMACWGRQEGNRDLISKGVTWHPHARTYTCTPAQTHARAHPPTSIRSQIILVCVSSPSSSLCVSVVRLLCASPLSLATRKRTWGVSKYGALTYLWPHSTGRHDRHVLRNPAASDHSVGF